MNTNNNFTNFVSLLRCSSNSAFKNNTLENEALLISDKKIHLTPLITNEQNESLVILDKNKVSINGDFDIKGKIVIDDIDLMHYISTNSYTNNILMKNDDNHIPGYSWSNNPTTGIYQSSIGKINFSVNSDKKFEINKDGLQIYGDMLNSRQFEKAIVNGIFLDIDNKLNVDSNITAKSLFIDNDTFYILDDTVNVDDLIINPDEDMLLVNNGIERYYDFSIVN